MKKDKNTYGIKHWWGGRRPRSPRPHHSTHPSLFTWFSWVIMNGTVSPFFLIWKANINSSFIFSGLYFPWWIKLPICPPHWTLTFTKAPQPQATSSRLLLKLITIIWAVMYKQYIIENWHFVSKLSTFLFMHMSSKFSNFLMKKALIKWYS